MSRRQALVIGGAIALGGASTWLLAARSPVRTIDAALWFEPIAFASRDLDGSITAADLAVIDAVARAEIRAAFAGLRFALSERRDAAFRIRVAPHVRDPRFRSTVEVAGASWPFAGGGHGAVSFAFLASGALAQTPPGADRATRIEAIGRGIGRSAVHELAHQLLPAGPMHGADADSYEYDSASRASQYFGALHWDVAWPVLQQRFGESRAP